MTDALSQLDDIIGRNRNGGPAIVSVCSAHPDVLRASLRLAARLDRTVLIEATSNQVNQHGGYTGMTPADFIIFVRGIMAEVGIDHDRVIFGGDHLGPQAWRSKPAAEAMDLARDMMRAYVEAGFRKIHLDCSEGCAGEPAAVGDALAASRAAELAAVCEETAPGVCAYVIGTEVPPPGGARTDEDAVAPTPPDRARATLDAHGRAFADAGLENAFSRVRALVLQPGLEFAPTHIDHFDIDQPDALSPILKDLPKMCFEAHSTDYQRPAVYTDLARRHFAIQKVGPALTFAWREAIYALSHIASWITGRDHISQTMETLMIEHPEVWESHYHGDAARLRLLRHFAYADRIRYLWAQPKAQTAVAGLLTDFPAHVPEPLLAQYLPQDTRNRAALIDAPLPQAMLEAHVEAALAPYFGEPAC